MKTKDLQAVSEAAVRLRQIAEGLDSDTAAALCYLARCLDTAVDGADWIESFRCRIDMRDALTMLDDVRFLAREREYSGIAVMVDAAITLLVSVARAGGLVDAAQLPQVARMRLGTVVDPASGTGGFIAEAGKGTCDADQ